MEYHKTSNPQYNKFGSAGEERDRRRGLIPLNLFKNNNLTAMLLTAFPSFNAHLTTMEISLCK